MNEWILKKMRVPEPDKPTLFDFLFPPKPTGNFYASSYACPYCGDWLYKTIFPIGKEYPIKTNTNKSVKMKRVFVCGACQTFFTAAIDKLSDGTIYELKIPTKNEFRTLYLDMNEKGSTIGRDD